MKAKLIKEAIDFKRGQSSKKALDVGMEGTSRMAISVKIELEDLGFQDLEIEEKETSGLSRLAEKYWNIIIPPPRVTGDAYNHTLRHYQSGGWTLTFGGSMVTSDKVDLDSALRALFDNYDALLDKSIIDAEHIKRDSLKMRNNLSKELGKVS